MIEVTLTDIHPNEILEIIQSLKQSGFVQGVDFDFEYHRPVFNDWSGDAMYNRYTIFTFHKDELATFFKLKYT